MQTKTKTSAPPRRNDTYTAHETVVICPNGAHKWEVRSLGRDDPIDIVTVGKFCAYCDARKW